MKWMRDYVLTVEGQDNTHEVRFPVTLDMDIVRNTLASANVGQFTIFNLRDDTRRDLFHDQYDTLNYKRIKLEAGYQTDGTLPVIFQGNVIVAGSRRNGVDWMTTIRAFDGGFAIINGQANITKGGAGQSWSAKDLVSSLVSGMPNVTLGAVGNITIPNARGVTVIGNAWEQLKKITGSGYQFIDNEQVNILAENEYILVDGAISLISAATGMIGSPRRQNALIEVDVMFEPRAVVGQIVQLQSAESVNNGFYQVRGVAHRGRISGAFDGGVITTLSLWVGTSRLTGVKQ
jgi:hypothetical protein